jgi:hypothetical protein
MQLLANADDKLYVPLRQWIVPPNRQRFIRPFYYDPLSDAVYFTHTGFYKYHRRLVRGSIFALEATDRILVLPVTSYPVTLNEHPLIYTVLIALYFLLWHPQISNHFAHYLMNGNPKSCQPLHSIIVPSQV